jgi:hypothetical protein
MSWKRLTRRPEVAAAATIGLFLLSRGCSEHKTQTSPERVEPAQTELVVPTNDAGGTSPSVLTQHNDKQRTGANLAETQLNPTNVNPSQFGLLFKQPVDGQIYAQPLYQSDVPVTNAKSHQTVTANVAYVVTLNNTVYAFDGDQNIPAYWSTHLGPPDGRTGTEDVLNCSQQGAMSNMRPLGHVGLYQACAQGCPQSCTTQPYCPPGSACPPGTEIFSPAPSSATTVGIVSTPVIDPSTGMMYVVARTRDSEGIRNYTLYRINTVDGTVVASVNMRSVSGRSPEFVPDVVVQRPGLLLFGNTVYAAFGAAIEGPTNQPSDTYWHGWILAYDKLFSSSSAPADSLCTTPTSEGGGIWQAGNGLAADSSNIYFATTNAWQCAFGGGDKTTGRCPSSSNCGQSGPCTMPNHYQLGPAPVGLEESFVKIPIGPGGTFQTPSTRATDEFRDVDSNDQDLGSSGPVLFTGGPSPELIGGGKPAKLYVLSTSTMLDVQRPFQAFADSYGGTPSLGNVNLDWARQLDSGPHLHGSPVVWTRKSNGESYLFAWSEGDHLRRFVISNATGLITTPGLASTGDCAQSPEKQNPPCDVTSTAPTLQAAPRTPLNTMPGAGLSLSANANQDGTAILWATLNEGHAERGPTPGHLYAFNADTLAQLWDERIPNYTKFASPTVVNGKVYVPTLGYELLVYGLRTLSAVPGNMWGSSGDVVMCQGTQTTLQVSTGDFNGDRKTDLLCSDLAASTGGGKWVSYSKASNTSVNSVYAGVDWTAPSLGWCYASTSTPAPVLLVGDFDGDGRSDLLCHDRMHGTQFFAFGKTVDTPNGLTSTLFTGTDAQIGDTGQDAWCYGSNFELHVGDVNGDGRTDLICHNTADGGLFIRYSDTVTHDGIGNTVPGTGAFSNWARTDYVAPSFGWCFGASNQFYVGDFDGDGRADILCHNTATGEKWVDFSRPVLDGRYAASPPFFVGGSDYHGSIQWCIGASAKLLIGDLNGDGRDDMFCQDTMQGWEWIDYAGPSHPNIFPATGSSVTSTGQWCFPSTLTPTPSAFLGDVDGDGRADVICHDSTSGNKYVAFSPITGH